MAKQLIAVGAGRYAVSCAKENVSPGGIMLPDSAQGRPSAGKITHVGEGAERADGSLMVPRYKVGQEVIFGKWAGQDLLDDFGVYVLHEADIMGVVCDCV